MEKKLIIPTEVKVCATCSYWDGERQVDEEYNLVVVADDCRGECLVREQPIDGLNDVGHMDNCAWETLEADAVPDGAVDAEAKGAPAGKS